MKQFCTEAVRCGHLHLQWRAHTVIHTDSKSSPVDKVDTPEV